VTGAARAYPGTNYVAPFSAFSPFGFNGRYLYLRSSVGSSRRDATKASARA
jgi:hypothetical protein